MNLAMLALLLTCVCFAMASKELEYLEDVSKKVSLQDLDKNESVLSLLSCKKLSSGETSAYMNSPDSSNLPGPVNKALINLNEEEISNPKENGVQFGLWHTEMDGKVYVIVVAEKKNLISSYGYEKNAELGVI